MSELPSDKQKLMIHHIDNLRAILEEAYVPRSVAHEVLTDFVTIRNTEMEIYHLRNNIQTTYLDKEQEVPFDNSFYLLGRQADLGLVYKKIEGKAKQSKSYRTKFESLNQAHIFYTKSDKPISSKMEGLFQYGAEIVEKNVPSFWRE